VTERNQQEPEELETSAPDVADGDPSTADDDNDVELHAQSGFNRPA
jgi:hypothetical protein